jgi:hypothetical protein
VAEAEPLHGGPRALLDVPVVPDGGVPLGCVVAQVPVRPRDRAAADLGPLGRVELSILP